VRPPAKPALALASVLGFLAAGEVPAKAPLRVAAAGALRPAVQLLAAGRPDLRVETVFSSSGGVLQAAREGRADVIVVGHENFLKQAREAGLIEPDSAVAVAYLVPVIVVPRGNPRGILTLADLVRPGMRLALADPGSTCLGATSHELFERAGIQAEIEARVTFSSESCEQTVEGVVQDRADAAVAWRVLPEWFADRVELIRLAGDGIPVASAWAAVAGSARKPERARAFLQHLTSAESRAVWAAQGYPTTEREARELATQPPFRRGW
jgi:molybdate transport system substrate-binding protein